MAGGPGFWGTLDGVLGGKTVTQVRDGYAAQQQAAARAAQMEGLYEKVAKSDPQAALAMRLNPTEYGKALSSNYEAANVGAGDSRRMNGQPTFTAPVMRNDNGVAFTQTPGGISKPHVVPLGLKDRFEIKDKKVDNVRADRELDSKISQFAQEYGLDERELAELIRTNQAKEEISRSRPSGGVNINVGGGVTPGAVQWDN